jgi:hypothetical protein
MLGFGLNGGRFVDGRGAQCALLFQQTFGLLAILAAIGLQQFVERGLVALGAFQFACCDAETARKDRDRRRDRE